MVYKTGFSTALECLPLDECVADTSRGSRYRESAQICTAQGVVDAIADLFHRIDHFIERDKVLVVRQGHVRARDRVHCSRDVSSQAGGLDAVADRIADQAARRRLQSCE